MMPYAIGKSQRGVYEVVAVQSRHHAIVGGLTVIRDGHAKIYEFSDEAEKECRVMNRERLRRSKSLEKSQKELW